MTTKQQQQLDPRVSFRVDDRLARQLAERARGDESVSLVARRQLERFHALLDDSLADAREALALTPSEAGFLAAIANGVFWELSSARLVWAEVLDADDALAAEWGVDKAALAERLRALSVAQRLAVIDALERWWARGGDGDHDGLVEGLSAVGLL